MSKKTIKCNTFIYRNNNPVVTGYRNSFWRHRLREE